MVRWKYACFCRRIQIASKNGFAPYESAYIAQLNWDELPQRIQKRLA